MTTLYTDPLTGKSYGIPLPRDEGQRPITLKDVTVVIPAYNEAEGIRDTLAGLRDGCPEADILVVDDGSTDATADIARSIPGIRVVSHIANRGYGAALKTGVRLSDREFIAWYDADGQHRPEDLQRVTTPVIERRMDAVIGVRRKGSARQRNRVLGKKVLHWVTRLVSGQPIPDVNSGLRCFRRDVISRYLHLLPDGFSASTTSTLMLIKRGYRLGYESILAQPRVGTSTVRIFSDGMRTLQLIMRIIVLFEAFKVFTTLGLAMILPGMIYGVTLAIVRGQGFPTLAGTLIISEVLTFFMGIVADQVVELRKERFEDDAVPIDRRRRSTDRQASEEHEFTMLQDTGDRRGKAECRSTNG